MILVHLEDRDLGLGKERPGLRRELERHGWERRQSTGDSGLGALPVQ